MNLGEMTCLTLPLICKACIEGKQHRIVFPNDERRHAIKPLEIMHSC